jgi:hypothetical protein
MYAITDRAAAVTAGRTGLEGAPLLTVPCREIAAVVSAVTAARVEATPANFWLHEEVVEGLMADSPVLPLRWGTVVPDERRLSAVLETHYDSFVAALERVRGRVELGLRVLWDGDALQPPPAEPGSQGNARPGASPGTVPPQPARGEPAATPGRRYLMARVEADRLARAERQRALGMADEIHRPLDRLAAESVREVLPTSRMLLAAAYLVDRDRVADVRAEADALAAAFPALRLLLTGPWPPYHFVTGCVPAEALLVEHLPAADHAAQWQGGR